jgi:LPS export ABC transporter protein LptC
MAKIKQTLIVLILLLLIIASCYFFYKTIFTHTTISKQNQQKPDVFIYNLNSTSFNKEGKIAAKLFTPEMSYNSVTKRSTLNYPEITVYKAKSAPWHITANRGEITNNNAIYKLTGNVKLQQGKSTKTLAMIITTPELIIYPDKSIAETHRHITFTQINNDASNITINAIGARANQKTGEVKLFSHTKGVYHAK